MRNGFTLKMAELLADTMIGSTSEEFNLYTDGEGLRVFTKGKCIDVYKVGDRIVNSSQVRAKVNVNAFKNTGGKILKGKLVDYLYKTINKILDKQKTEEFYKNMYRKSKSNKSINKGNHKQPEYDDKDSGGLDF